MFTCTGHDCLHVRVTIVSVPRLCPKTHVVVCRSELEQIQTQMAPKPILRVEVGARALRNPVGRVRVFATPTTAIDVACPSSSSSWLVTTIPLTFNEPVLHQRARIWSSSSRARVSCGRRRADLWRVDMRCLQLSWYDTSRPSTWLVRHRRHRGS